MGNLFSQARDDRTIMSTFRPSRPTHSSNKLSRPCEAILPSQSKTLEKTLKTAKPYNSPRTTRPDHLHRSAKDDAGPPRPPVPVSSDRYMGSPAELESVSLYDFCFPGLENEPLELEKEPPKVNYGTKPTLQPQDVPAQAPITLRTIPLARIGPEQPLTPPPTPPRAVQAPPLPPRPPPPQQPPAMAVPLPGNARYLKVNLGESRAPEPSWGPMDARRDEVTMIQGMVKGSNWSKRSKMSLDEYLTAVAALKLPPYSTYHIRRAWRLFGGDVQKELPLCSVPYLLTLLNLPRLISTKLSERNMRLSYIAVWRMKLWKPGNMKTSRCFITQPDG